MISRVERADSFQLNLSPLIFQAGVVVLVKQLTSLSDGSDS